MRIECLLPDLLHESIITWKNLNSDNNIYTMALRVHNHSVIRGLEVLSKDNNFLFFWDDHRYFTLAAAGQCQHLLTDSSDKHNLAEKFSRSIFNNIFDFSRNCPNFAKSKILYAFPFSDYTLDDIKNNSQENSLEAVLPKWSLISNYQETWLRINFIAIDESSLRNSIEELWIMRQTLLSMKNNQTNNLFSFASIQSYSNQIKFDKVPIRKGIQLTKQNILEKIVIAVRCKFKLNKVFSKINFLLKLKNCHPNSYIYLWQNKHDDYLLGASPERLFSFNDDKITVDALAGTAKVTSSFMQDLYTKKNLKEHQLVVSFIANIMTNLCSKIEYPKSPSAKDFGRLMHLFTEISGKSNGKSPFDFLRELHPTPAVAGVPRKLSLNWIGVLENFERSYYASPIGWLSHDGTSQFLVALRCLKIIDNYVQITAGAGLVSESDFKEEIEEINEKLFSIYEQILPFIDTENYQYLLKSDSIT